MKNKRTLRAGQFQLNDHGHVLYDMDWKVLTADRQKWQVSTGKGSRGVLPCEHRIYEPKSLKVSILGTFYGYRCLCYRYPCYRLFPSVSYYNIPML